MMETTRQRLEQRLIDCGLFDKDAKAVMNAAIPKLDKGITWTGPADDYPQQLYDVLFVSIKPIVKEWITANAPLAWFAPLFD